MATDKVPIPGRSDGGSGAGATIRAALLTPTVVRRSLTAVLFAVVSARAARLVTPPQPPRYPTALSRPARSALAGRRWFASPVVLMTLPRSLVGWADLAGILSRGWRARRNQGAWQVWLGLAMERL